MKNYQRINEYLNRLKSVNDIDKISLNDLKLGFKIKEILKENHIETMEDLLKCDPIIFNKKKKMFSIERSLRRLIYCFEKGYTVIDCLNNENLSNFIKNNLGQLKNNNEDGTYQFILEHINSNNKQLGYKKKKHKKKIISLYKIAHGKESAKIFSKEDFLNIYNPLEAKNLEYLNKRKKLKNENIYVYCNSGSEQYLIDTLQKHNSFELLRTQFPKIPNGKLGYHPDLFLITKNGYIVVIEVKPQFDMNSRNSKKQYRLLKNYCLSKGYLYLMCDKKLFDYENLNDVEVSRRIKDSINYAIKDHGSFNIEDYKKLMPLDKKDRKKKRSIDNQIGKYVKQAGLLQSGRWTKKMKIHFPKNK